MHELVNLYGHTRDQLEAMFVSQGQQAFRGRQLMKWIYHDGVTDFSAMTDLPLDTRKWLVMSAQLEVPKVVSQERSSDGTVKWAVQVNQDEFVETVLIPEKGRNTLCVSSQVGCSLDCSFCATGKQGFNGNLSAEEIVGQLLLANDYLSDRDESVTNVVFMGMGEPLLNIRNVLDSIECLTNDIGIGQRKITVSTVGIPNTLSDLAKLAQDRLGRVKFTLAVSLHAPNQTLRELIIPSASSYPINSLLKDCRTYIELTGRRVSFEYILLGGLNDKDIHAEQLADLMRGFQSHVNLIAYNPIAEENFKRPSQSRVNSFRELLENKGVAVSVRASRGRDKDAACGQLRRQTIDKIKIN